MRLNQFLASASGISRRQADILITLEQVRVNNAIGKLGQQINPKADQITLNDQVVCLAVARSIILNKPIGYVTSKAGQGNQTIYDLLPTELQNLKPAGRLDKDSCGLLVLTNDGQLAQRLIHPSSGKTKRYLVKLNQALSKEDRLRLSRGVPLSEGISQMKITKSSGSSVVLELATGWNRQIRRSFQVLGYQVVALQRLSIGQLELGNLGAGKWRDLTKSEAIWLST